MELNKIYNQDCLEGLKNVPDKSIDLVVTDGPYDIHSGHGGGIYDLKKHPDKKYIAELTEISDGFSEAILDELCRVMKAINIYLFCSKAQVPWLLDYFVTRKGCNFEILIWEKTNPVPACGNKYLTDKEYCLFFRQKGVRIYGTVDTKRTVYRTTLNVRDKQEWGHPTIKPLSLVENLIINSSVEGDTVLDPFMGSGTTGVAAQRNGRNYIGFEINPTYCEIADKRLNELRLF